MEASQEHIEALLLLQQTDLEQMRAQREFDELPQRQALLDIRAKRATVQEKKGQVDALLEDAEQRFARVSEEDASLARKAVEVQTAINEAGGDYRNLESRTKELDGIARRRKVLEGELDKVDERLAKARAAADQVSAALDVIDKQERALIASFQKEGVELRDKVAAYRKRHEVIVGALPAELSETYAKTAQRCGGVAIGSLKGTSCGVCRVSFDGGKLTALRAQAPLGVCPSCKRLLVIE